MNTKKTTVIFPKYNLRLLLLLLAILTTTSSFALVAYDFEVDGIYYRIEYGSDDEVYVTSRDFEGNSYSGDVFIPENVSYAGKIYTVTEIGGLAFQGCSGLLSVRIPNTVIRIRYQAFEGCSGLSYIDIPNSVTVIEQAAFMYCSGLTDLNIGNSVTTIEAQAFEGCSALTSLTIPNSVENIYGLAFDGCSGLRSINLGNNVFHIGEGAFSHCTQLNNVTIPSTVSFIGNGAFSGCSALESIVVESENPVFDSRNNCNAIIETSSNKLIIGCNTSIIPNDVSSIEDWAFFECSEIQEINIPSSVTCIGMYAFSGCSGLVDLDLPNSITSMGEGAFQNCSGLINLHISNSLNKIETNAFQSCTSLKSVTLPNSISSIGVYSFSGCSNLISIDIPNGVDSIMDGAFWSCDLMKGVTIPESVSFIGNDSFSYCGFLHSIIVQDGNHVYDSRDNCNAIIETASNTLICGCRNSVIPNSVISIGDGAFVGCDKLITVCIPNSVKSIGARAFSGSGLTSITIPNSVTSIGESAFSTIRLKNVSCLATNPPAIRSAFPFSVTNSVTLHVPRNSLEAYQSASYWKSFKTIIDDALETDSIVMSRTNITMSIENQFTLTATITPENSVPNNLVWMSSDDSVAVVDNGVITAVASGECDILAICQNKQAVCRVIVGNSNNGLKGDVNDDGVVSVADVTTLIDLLLNAE